MSPAIAATKGQRAGAEPHCQARAATGLHHGVSVPAEGLSLPGQRQTGRHSGTAPISYKIAAVIGLGLLALLLLLLCMGVVGAMGKIIVAVVPLEEMQIPRISVPSSSTPSAPDLSQPAVADVYQRGKFSQIFGA
jgi:hypothetical protein